MSSYSSSPRGTSLPGGRGVREKTSLVFSKTQILTSAYLGLGPRSWQARPAVGRKGGLLGLHCSPRQACAPLSICPFHTPPPTLPPCPGSPLGLDPQANTLDVFPQSMSQHLGPTAVSPWDACVLGNRWENWNHEIGRGLGALLQPDVTRTGRGLSQPSEGCARQVSAGGRGLKAPRPRRKGRQGSEHEGNRVQLGGLHCRMGGPQPRWMAGGGGSCMLSVGCGGGREG